MLYLYQNSNGTLGFASDWADREWAAREDKRHGYESGDTMEGLHDTAQMAARAIGLFEITGDYVSPEGWKQMRVSFPYGPIALSRELIVPDMEQTIANVLNGYQSAEVEQTPEGPWCEPLAERRPGPAQEIRQ